MKYLFVRWKHPNPEDPTLLYSELNEDRWEVRKVEVYADGRLGYADNDKELKKHVLVWSRCLRYLKLPRTQNLNQKKLLEKNLKGFGQKL